jgi:hypothetical protein
MKPASQASPRTHRIDGADQEWVRGFTIITCPPKELCALIHNRMLVILPPPTDNRARPVDKNALFYRTIRMDINPDVSFVAGSGDCDCGGLNVIKDAIY